MLRPPPQHHTSEALTHKRARRISSIPTTTRPAPPERGGGERGGGGAYRNELSKDLVSAVRKADLEAARECLEQGADPDGPTGGAPSATPLGLASESGLADIVGLLLAHGASVDKEDGRVHVKGTLPHHFTCSRTNRPPAPTEIHYAPPPASFFEECSCGSFSKTISYHLMGAGAPI